MRKEPGLTGKQIRHLRGLGHHLKPMVLVGKDGVTESLLKTVEECLEDHELLKIKLLDTCPCDRREAASDMAAKTGAHVVQVLGRTILLYRRSEEPAITLP